MKRNKGGKKAQESLAPTSFDRRLWLKAAGAGGGLLVAGGMLGKPGKSRAAGLPGLKPGAAFQDRKLDPNAGLSVVLLGTGTPIPNPDRACAATLVIAGDKTFLVDTGRGFLTRLVGAGLNNVSMVLFTHFHSDHFGEFGELMVNRGIAGVAQPMPVIGPAGVKEVIGSLLSAYALDNKYRKAHHGDKWSESAMRAEIAEKTPGVVSEADGVKITMFEVEHPPVVPAMGYRFDYKGQSVVVSGDTKKCAKMVEMAQGADVLVHEAANRKMTELAIKNMRANAGPANQRMAAMAEEMLTYHTMTDEVAQIARDAGVKKLVLTHLAPSLPENAAMERIFVLGMSGIYKGDIIVGRDGMEIKV
ncbi:MAG TPA: MBL fold metallo-hydrolase [bacterium]|nr:MBL fold metallo-hydrolase [bacterium]